MLVSRARVLEQNMRQTVAVPNCVYSLLQIASFVKRPNRIAGFRPLTGTSQVREAFGTLHKCLYEKTKAIIEEPLNRAAIEAVARMIPAGLTLEGPQAHQVIEQALREANTAEHT